MLFFNNLRDGVKVQVYIQYIVIPVVYNTCTQYILQGPWVKWLRQLPREQKCWVTYNHNVYKLSCFLQDGWMDGLINWLIPWNDVGIFEGFPRSLKIVYVGSFFFDSAGFLCWRFTSYVFCDWISSLWKDDNDKATSFGHHCSDARWRHPQKV